MQPPSRFRSAIFSIVGFVIFLVVVLLLFGGMISSFVSGFLDYFG
jgi:lipopolysaccharide export LptBFGC system permease protein LptF